MDYRKPSTLTHEELEDICNRLGTDETLVSIAVAYDLNVTSLRAMLRRIGIRYGFVFDGFLRAEAYHWLRTHLWHTRPEYG